MIVTAVLLFAGGVHGWGYCNDSDESCANWAKAGECEKQPHIKEACPHSCAVCPHICRDEHMMCTAWKDAGQCKANFDYMAKHCSASCGLCKTRCYDKEPACLDWARNGECSKNTDLLTLCPESCGVCTDLCLDKAEDCPFWAASGACANNPSFMLKECPNSCAVCTDKTHGGSRHPVQVHSTGKHRELTTTSACADVDRLQCLVWGEHECSRNPAAVMRECPHMCHVCTLACEDKYTDCPNWAEGKASGLFGNKSGKGCEDNKDFMHLNCPQSCGICSRLHVFPTRTDQAPALTVGSNPPAA